MSAIVASEEWRRLDPRHPKMARQRAAFRALMLTAGVIGVELFMWWMLELSRDRTELIVIVSAVLLLPALVALFVAPGIHYRHAAWRLTQDALELRRGAWWRSEIRVPFGRIQYTDVRQSPFQRRYGLGTVDIYTAGNQLNSIELAGLAHEDALALRDRLIEIRESPI